MEKSEVDHLGVCRVESCGAKPREEPGSAWGRGRRHCKDRGRRSGTPQCAGCLGPTVWEMVRSGVKTAGTEAWVGKVSDKGGELDGQGTRVQTEEEVKERAVGGLCRIFSEWTGAWLRRCHRVTAGSNEGPGRDPV